MGLGAGEGLHRFGISMAMTTLLQEVDFLVTMTSKGFAFPNKGLACRLSIHSQNPVHDICISRLLMHRAEKRVCVS